MNIVRLSSPLVAAPVTLGAAEADRRLQRGLARGALHEIYAAEEDGAAAIGFSLLLALRAVRDEPIVVIRDDRGVKALGRLYGDGVAELGGDPARLIVVHTADALATLRAAADAAACPNVGAVVVAPWGAAPVFDLTASRRLALRAERARGLILIVRIGIDPSPSAAMTRWQVRGSPSSALAAGAPGHSAFEINLLRHRGGLAGFATRVEWDRDQRSFRDAPQPRAVPAVAAGRTGDAGERRAA